MSKPKKNEAKQDFLKRCSQSLIDGGESSLEAFKTCNIAWDNANSQRAALNLSMPVDFAKKTDSDTAADAFMITAYTGKPMSTWYGDIIIDLGGIDTKEKIPILREHARDRVVGFGNATNDKNSLYVAGQFSKSTQDAAEVKALADEGYPWQASISVRAAKVAILADSKAGARVNGRDVSGPMEIWRESEVGEVSFVTLGRDDDTAAISLSASDDRNAVTFDDNFNLQEVEPMPITLEQLTKEAPELLASIQDESRQEAYSEGYEEGTGDERTRVIEILGAGSDPAVTLSAITDGVSADAAYKIFYHAEVKNRGEILKTMAAEATDPVETPDPVSDPAKLKEPKTEAEVRAAWAPVMGPAAVN